MVNFGLVLGYSLAEVRDIVASAVRRYESFVRRVHESGNVIEIIEDYCVHDFDGDYSNFNFVVSIRGCINECVPSLDCRVSCLNGVMSVGGDIDVFDEDDNCIMSGYHVGDEIN